MAAPLPEATVPNRQRLRLQPLIEPQSLGQDALSSPSGSGGLGLGGDGGLPRPLGASRSSPSLVSIRTNPSTSVRLGEMSPGPLSPMGPPSPPWPSLSPAASAAAILTSPTSAASAGRCDGGGGGGRREGRRRPAVELGAEGTKHLLWSKPVQHPAVACVRVQIVASSKKKVATIGCGLCAECGIEVWAEGHTTGGSVAPVKVALCRASLSPKNSHLCVHWLCRTKEGPVLVAVSDGHTTAGAATAQDVNSWRFVDPAGGGRSLAEAVLGLMAAVGEAFGMIFVDLEAEDNGSGKLLALYRRLGFTMVSEAKKGELPEMQAPIKAIAALAPPAWLQGLVPTDFNPFEWLQDDASPHQVERLLLSPDVPWSWTWKADWPHGSRVDVKLSFAGKSCLNKVDAEVWLMHRNGIELAFARGAIRMKQRALKVIWFGRSKSRAVHPNVKGQKAYCPSYASGSGLAPGEPTTTAAVATLGALAGLARWFGTTTVELMALDHGSGRLWSYLDGLGFADERGAQRFSAEDPPILAASCRDLASTCCPPEWRAQLPTDGELGILTKMIGREA